MLFEFSVMHYITICWPNTVLSGVFAVRTRYEKREYLLKFVASIPASIFHIQLRFFTVLLALSSLKPESLVRMKIFLLLFSVFVLATAY